MRLVGKKLYRTGPLRLFNVSTAQMSTISNPSQYDTRRSTGGGGGVGGGSGSSGPSPAEIERRRKAAEKARKIAEAKKLVEDTRMQNWEKTAMTDLYDKDQQAVTDKQMALADKLGDPTSMMEKRFKQDISMASSGKLSPKELARLRESGQRTAIADQTDAYGRQSQALGAAQQGRFDKMRSDKMGKLGYFQKRRGLEVAEKAAAQQAAATRAANSGGKAAGGEIFKEFKRKNGKIEGPGTETSDSIRAMLSDGEFVVNAKTVRGLGEAMGAKGKEESRKKGAGFLYDLQTKYGDKKPVKKMGGGMMLAELGAHAAKKGLMGKKLQGVGEVASDTIDVKKGFDEKKQKELKLSKGGVIHHPVKATPQDVLKKKKSGGEIKKDKDKDKKDKGLTTKEKWNLGLAIGQAAIGARAKALQAEKDRKHKLAEGLRESYQTLADAGNALIGSGVALKDGGEVKNWIQGAVKKPGALRAVAKKDKLIKGDEKLSSSDLNKLASKAKKSGDSLLAKRVNLAKTFAKMRKAKGGEVKLGKGVKAKRKYREAIGWESDKIFDKKAEKDYKKGDTGYKNYKGEKSVTPVEMSLGGFLGKVARVGLKAGAGFLQGGPAGAAVGAGKGVMDEVSADKQKAQQKKQVEAQIQSDQASKMSQAGKELASGEVELKKGGDVKQSKEDLELQKFLDFHFPKGKKVETDPEKKAWEAISKEEGSIEPVKMETGGIMQKLTMGPDPGAGGIDERKRKAIQKAKDLKTYGKGPHQQYKDPELKKAIVERLKKKKEPVKKGPSFKQAFDQAEFKGKPQFDWKDPKTGKVGKYKTERKGQGGVHSQFDEKGHKAFKKHQEDSKDKRGFFSKLGDVLYTGSLKSWGDKKHAAQKRKEYDEATAKHKMVKAHPNSSILRRVPVKEAPVKEAPVKKAPVKSDDRVKQIRAQLKGLIRPDKKYSKKEGIAKAKLYKELAALGKPSKFGKYWMKTYLKDGGSVSFKDVLAQRQKYKKGGSVLREGEKKSKKGFLKYFIDKNNPMPKKGEGTLKYLKRQLLP